MNATVKNMMVERFRNQEVRNSVQPQESPLLCHHQENIGIMTNFPTYHAAF